MSKKEKTALVPRLRFAEFREEWQTKTFEETFKFHQNNTFSRIEMNCEQGNVKNIHYGDILIKYSCIISDTSTIPFINNNIDLTRFRKDSYLQSGDIIIADTAEDSTAGKAVEIQNVDYAILSGLHTMLCRPQHIAAPKYFGYFLNSPVYRNAIIPLLTGSKVSSISKSNINKTIIMIPKFAEQQKIADCLSSLDDLITAEDKKLATLKLHKKGLMQKLFPAEGKTVPEFRFPEFRDSGDWELITIGEKVDLLSGYSFKGDEISQDPTGIPLMRGINITEGLIRHNQSLDRFFCNKLDGLEKYQLQKDDLVIGMDGSKVGKNSALITIEDEGSLLIQRVARLRSNFSTTILFIFHHINSNKFHSYVDKINTSSGIPHISAKQIEEFEIYFPIKKNEQQKIADCLSSLDDIVTMQTEKIKVLKTHKKGLLQGLFPSVEEVG